MKAKLTFLAGLAAGYVLGSKAGREHYESLKKSFKSMLASEPFQDAVATVQHTVKEQAQDAAEKLGIPTHESSAHTDESSTANSSGSGFQDSTGHVKPSDVRRDISPKVSDEFPDAALKGGEGEHWDH